MLVQKYNAVGNIIEKTKKGVTLQYIYDASDRKLSEGSRKFEYDPYDNIAKASYNNKSIEYTYDKFNNVTRVVDANDNVVEYQWDIYRNRTIQQRYTYCANNQYKYVAPSGHDAGVLGGVFGGLASAIGGLVSLITVVGWAVTVITGIGLIGYGIYKNVKSEPNTKLITQPYISPKPRTILKPKVISKVIEVVSPTVAKALKLTKAVFDVLPQSCPTLMPRGWN